MLEAWRAARKMGAVTVELEVDGGVFTYPSEMESFPNGGFREVQRQHDKDAVVRLVAWRVE